MTQLLVSFHWITKFYKYLTNKFVLTFPSSSQSSDSQGKQASESHKILRIRSSGASEELTRAGKVKVDVFEHSFHSLFSVQIVSFVHMFATGRIHQDHGNKWLYQCYGFKIPPTDLIQAWLPLQSIVSCRNQWKNSGNWVRIGLSAMFAARL